MPSPLPLLVAVLSAAPAEWSLFTPPRLCATPPAARVPDPLLDAAHLDLRGGPRVRVVDPAPAALPLPIFLQILEQDLRARGRSLELRAQGDLVLARGEPEALDAARALVRELDQVADALQVDLEVKVEAAGRAPLVLTRSVASGATTFLGEREARSFVAGFEVEVAQDAGQSEPALGSAFSGQGLHLTATRLAGGARVHLEGLLDVAEVREVATFDPDTPDLGALEQPVVPFVQVAFSGSVPSGGALTVQLADAGPVAGALTLTVRATARPDPAGRADGWAVLDLAFLAATPLELEAVDPGAALAGARTQEEALSPLFSPSAVAALVEADRASSSARAPRSGPYWSETLLVLQRADGERLETVRALVAAAEAARAATLVADVGAGALRASIPCTPGRAARLVAGVERPYLVDYALEVAPQVWMPSPEVERAFDGLCVDLRARADAVEVGAWRASTPEVRAAPRSTGQVGSLQLLRRSLSAAGGRAVVGAAALGLLAGPEPLGVSVRAP